MRSVIVNDLYLAFILPPKAYLNKFACPVTDQRIRFLSHFPDKLLADLYVGVTSRFFPSRYWGFSLLLLNSMACGIPVFTIHNNSLAEVRGDAAIYVNLDWVEMRWGNG